MPASWAVTGLETSVKARFEMATAKIAITMDADTVRKIDRLVGKRVFPNRSRAIQEAVDDGGIEDITGTQGVHHPVGRLCRCMHQVGPTGPTVGAAGSPGEDAVVGPGSVGLAAEELLRVQDALGLGIGTGEQQDIRAIQEDLAPRPWLLQLQ